MVKGMNRLRRTRFILLSSWLIALLSGRPALAAPGDLDSTFDDDGKVTTNFTKWLDSARAVAVQPDGRIVAAGRAGSASRWFGLARYRSDGMLDPTFGDDGRVITNLTDGTDQANGVVIQPNGKIVAAGGAGSRFGLARYRPNGYLDPVFGSDGTVTTDFPQGGDVALDVALQSDGKIVAAGVARDSRFAVARYNANGTLDSTFGGDGRVTTTFAGSDLALGHGVGVRGNKVVVVGGVVGKFAVARYRANGTLDPTFSGDGRLTTDFTPGFDSAQDVAIQPDGKIVAAGTTGEGTDPAFALARYEGDGTLDPTFSDNGKLTTQFPFGEDIAHGVALQADGKIVAAGATGEGGPFSRFAVARYLEDGALDGTFGAGGKVTTPFVEGYDFTIAHGVAIQPDGNIVAAGSVGGGGGRFGLARYLAA
jgi:uncharacterized delta-60 repeat protein